LWKTSAEKTNKRPLVFGPLCRRFQPLIALPPSVHRPLAINRGAPMAKPSKDTAAQPHAVDKVLPVPEAAQFAGISRWTLKRAAARGELKILRLSPRRVGVRQSEFARWLNSRAST
jgi:predicted DNA-binding transcriptional regulator AlpA